MITDFEIICVRQSTVRGEGRGHRTTPWIHGSSKDLFPFLEEELLSSTCINYYFDSIPIINELVEQGRIL